MEWAEGYRFSAGSNYNLTTNETHWAVVSDLIKEQPSCFKFSPGSQRSWNPPGREK